MDHFFMFFRVFSPNFSSASLEEFFFDSFHGFGCYDEPHYLPPTLEWIHDSSPFNFIDFSLFPQNLGFLVHPKSEGKSSDLGKTLLGTCSLGWGDPCVEVSFNLEHYSSRIKLGKKEADFGRKSRFSETSCQTMSDMTQTWSDLQVWVLETSNQTMFVSTYNTPGVTIAAIVHLQFLYNGCYSINLIQWRWRFLLFKLDHLKSIQKFEF
jgi:hypothetical protein